MLSSRLLRQFLTVTDCGGLRAAAAILGLSQPALTKNMRQIEQALGVTLFDRHSRGMALTAFGEVLRRRAALIELEHRYACAEIEALRGGSSGVIRIGAGPLWSYRHLPAAVAELHGATPGRRCRCRLASPACSTVRCTKASSTSARARSTTCRTTMPQSCAPNSAASR